MSFSSTHFPDRQALNRQKTALSRQFRQNLLLKVVSVFSAIILYIFVQAEHSTTPVSSRQGLVADVIYEHQPPNIEVDAPPKHISVSVSGPRLLVENLKEGDVHAVVDLANRSGDTTKPQPVTIDYRIPSLTPDAVSQMRIDGPPTVHLLLVAHTKRSLNVHITPFSAPAGYHYNSPEIMPETVVCSGREDVIDKVDRLIVTPTPGSDRKIDGSFQVVALDAKRNQISDLTLTPNVVHVKISLRQDPPARDVTVSPIFSSLPMPPWSTDKITVTPSQVKIQGKPDLLEHLYTINTEHIDLKDVTDKVSVTVNLVPPPGMTITDFNGHLITQVRVDVILKKQHIAPTNVDTPPDNGLPVQPPNNG